MAKALVVRCDANAETGLGHFARCRDLVRLLCAEQPDIVPIFAGDLSSVARAATDALGFSTLPLPQGEPLLSPALAAALEKGARLLVDSYRLDAETASKLGRTSAAWAAFDDFAKLDFAGAALVINTRVGAETTPYRARHAARGPAYFPATPELSRLRSERSERPAPAQPRRIVVFVGGYDRYAAGIALAEAAASAFRAAEVSCVQQAPLGAAAAGVVWGQLAPEISSWLGQADLVIAGGGRLKYEAAYCLLPCASVSQTEEQAEDTAELGRRELCWDLGSAATLDPARTREALLRLWQPSRLELMRAAQAREFPEDAGSRLARAVTRALALE